MKCPKCGGDTIALFTSVVCKAECDRYVPTEKDANYGFPGGMNLFRAAAKPFIFSPSIGIPLMLPWSKKK